MLNVIDNCNSWTMFTHMYVISCYTCFKLYTSILIRKFVWWIFLHLSGTGGRLTSLLEEMSVLIKTYWMRTLLSSSQFEFVEYLLIKKYWMRELLSSSHFEFVEYLLIKKYWMRALLSSSHFEFVEYLLIKKYWMRELLSSSHFELVVAFNIACYAK